MITLNVKEYCSGCEDFKPVTDGPQYAYDLGERYMLWDHVVKCKHCDRCERIYNRMLKEEKEKNNV